MTSPSSVFPPRNGSARRLPDGWGEIFSREMSDRQLDEFFSLLRPVVNEIHSSRQEWMRNTRRIMDPRRDVFAECGFPAEPDAFAYAELIRRDALAARVNEVYAKESWQVFPEVYEAEDGEVVTAFERAWADLGRALRGEYSFYKPDDENAGHPLVAELARADVECGKGRFGAIFFGFDDGLLDLRLPVRGVEEKFSVGLRVARTRTDPKTGKSVIVEKGDEPPDAMPGVYNLRCNAVAQPGPGAPTLPSFGFGANPYDPEENSTYLTLPGTEDPLGGKPDDPAARGAPSGAVTLRFVRVLNEAVCQVARVEGNFTSPRFGLPVSYYVNFNDPALGPYPVTSGAMTGSAYTREVHWTRIVHVCEEGTSPTYAPPRLEPVLNEILTAQKSRWASGEGYWLTCFSYLFFKTQAGAQDLPVNRASVKDMMENLLGGLQRHGVLEGLEPVPVTPSVQDPNPFFDLCVKVICIKLGVPQRIFMGSERGELASSQDDAAWNDRLRARQQSFITTRIVVPVIDRLIAVGVLPEPNYVAPAEPDPADPSEVDGTGDPLDPAAGADPAAPDTPPMLTEKSPDQKPPEPPPVVGAPGAVPPQFQKRPVGNARRVRVPARGVVGRLLRTPVRNDLPPFLRKKKKPVVGDRGGDNSPPPPPGDKGTPAGLPGGAAAVDPNAPDAGRGDPGSPDEFGDASAEPAEPPEPPGYCVSWPDLESQGIDEKATVGLKRTQALAAYVAGGVEAVVPLYQYLTAFLEMTDAEAQSIVDEAERKAAEQRQLDLQHRQTMIDQGITPDPTQQLPGQGGPPGAPDSAPPDAPTDGNPLTPHDGYNPEDYRAGG
jgi:hypothetical protein